MNVEDINKKIKSDGSLKVKLNVDIGVSKKGDIGFIDDGPISSDGKIYQILIYA